MHFEIKILGLKAGGYSIKNEIFFDTLKVQSKTSLKEIQKRANEKHINLRYFENGSVSDIEK